MRIERGQWRGAADVSNPRTWSDCRRDLGDRPVGNADDDEVRFPVVERDSPFGEARRERNGMVAPGAIVLRAGSAVQL